MEPAPGEATRLLRRVGAGDAEAADQLLSVLYDELHRIAAGYMRRERGDHTLQPTALVHEAWLRVLDGVPAAEAPAADASMAEATDEGAPGGWSDRRHFLRLAARAMRRALVDHARARSTAKREGARERVPLDDVLASFESQSIEVLALDEGLLKLATVDEPLARLVELRFFGGLTMEETARALEVSRPTAERRWRVARMWLRRELLGEGV